MVREVNQGGTAEEIWASVPGVQPYSRGGGPWFVEQKGARERADKGGGQM